MECKNQDLDEEKCRGSRETLIDLVHAMSVEALGEGWVRGHAMRFRHHTSRPSLIERRRKLMAIMYVPSVTVPIAVSIPISVPITVTLHGDYVLERVFLFVYLLLVVGCRSEL